MVMRCQNDIANVVVLGVYICLCVTKLEHGSSKVSIDLIQSTPKVNIDLFAFQKQCFKQRNNCHVTHVKTVCYVMSYVLSL